MATTLSAQYPWVQHPLICGAPMAGSAGGSLAAAISASGGIGFVGTIPDYAKATNQLVEARRVLKQRGVAPSSDGKLPIGVGFLCFAVKLEDAVALVKEYEPSAVWLFAVEELKDYAIWASKMRSVSNVRVWVQTGSVADALEIARTCKPDTIVVQGTDAGGHGARKGAGIVSLLPEVTDALESEGFGHIPLIAAGGITDHRGVVASMALGAAGVTMGTRFLASEEVNLTHPAWLGAILAAKDGGQSTLKAGVFDDMNTNITWPSWFDGRALRNETSRDWEAGVADEKNRSSFQEAAKKDEKGYLPGDWRATIWAGTGVGLVNEVLPASKIVEETRTAAKKLLESLKSNL